MQNRTHCALCRESGSLRDSHYLPAALYRLARTREAQNPHPVLISANQYRQLAVQGRAYLLCNHCESRLDQGGESWMLHHCSRGRGRFRLRDLLGKQQPLAVDRDPLGLDRDILIYRVDETIARHLTYFATSVFWRGAVREWPIGRDSTELLELGPFEEPMRLYLLGLCQFPSRIAISVFVSNRPHPPLASAYPRTFKDEHGMRFHRFYIPGLMFTLYAGNSAATVEFMSVTTAPVHPVLFGPMSDELYMRDVVQFLGHNNPTRA